jgi:LSD1 subclass zinc finger protein
VNNPPTNQAAPSAQEFPCGNCGAKLHYDAGSQSMKCPYCGFAQAVPQQQQHHPAAGGGREIPIEEGLRMAQRGFGTPVTQVACNDCGATVNVTPGEQTAKCAFCGSQKVLAQEAAGTAIRPESMVPFKVDKSGANKKFEEWIGGLWFRPNDLKKMAKLQEMGGVYIPFWTFDSWVRSDWTAEAGYHYYETEYYTDANGNRQSRQVQRTRWQFASGWRTDFFDDVLVCASKGLPQDLVSKFQTFDTKQLTPYRPEFLAGWRAESYAIDLMPAWGSAQTSMAATQTGRCGSDVPGDTHRNLSVNNQFSAVTFKHVLLPIWIAAYRYNNKPYQFLVNGQTGEVVGLAPWSFWKIFFAVLGGIALVTAIVLIYNYTQEPPRSPPPPAIVTTPPVAAPPPNTPPGGAVVHPTATVPPKPPATATTPPKATATTPPKATATPPKTH